MTDEDSLRMVGTWLVVGLALGVIIWLLHSHVPSATDMIKSIKMPSLPDMLQGIKP